MCACDAGWQTAIETQKSNNAQTTLPFEKRVYCDVPVDPNYRPNGAACGFWATEQIAKGATNWCTIKSEFQSLRAVLSPDPVIKLYVQSCGKSVNPLFLNLECGGSTRGTCLGDNRYGTKCSCKNGYTGLACDDLVCPAFMYINGAVCSGNGFCDNPTLNLGAAFDPSAGSCVCKPGFGGYSCEIRRLECGNSQTVRNYPLSHNISSII